jgi:hypothetical protein
MKSDAIMQALYRKRARLPNAEPAASSVAKAHVPQDPGYQALLQKAEELRQADPKLTKEQAFTKVYTDRGNADLVMMHKRVA